MYTVMIVDDEPAAISYMSKIVEKKCPDFEIIDTANDGKEALDKVRIHVPDVVIIDICMPGTDGLAMAEKIREWEMPITILIVSGYSEFEYARRAIQNGVIDYLLKPVVPDEVKIIFKKIKIKLDEEYFRKKNNLLRQLCLDVEINKEDLKKYFGKQNYYVALARYNGLPMRFSSINSKEVFSDTYERIYTYGRDERENLYLFPEELIGRTAFKAVIATRIHRDTIEKGYCTTVLSSAPISCEEIYGTVKQLYHTLNNCIILGKTYTIDIQKYHPRFAENNVEEKVKMMDFRFFSEKGEIGRAKAAVEILLAIWQKQEYPLLWIESKIRNMYSVISQTSQYETLEKNFALNEELIEDIFSNSQNMEQLREGIEEVLFQSKGSVIQEDKLDTEEFIEKVCTYLKKNMEKTIGVQDVCKEFGVSQTYLGKLFRKHKGMAVNTYFTSIRMEKAKELMKQTNEILIKDISERLGYKDQFYFSRVFRSYTGKCPSEYIEEIKEL